MQRKFIVLVLMALMFWGGPASAIGLAASGPSDQGDPAQAPAKALPFDIEDKPIDRAGEAVGEGIEKIGDSAAAKMGRWISTEAFYGIRWFKLILCLAAVAGVILCERILRIFIQAKIKRAFIEECWIWKSMVLQKN